MTEGETQDTEVTGLTVTLPVGDPGGGSNKSAAAARAPVDTAQSFGVNRSLLTSRSAGRA